MDLNQYLKNPNSARAFLNKKKPDNTPKPIRKEDRVFTESQLNTIVTSLVKAEVAKIPKAKDGETPSREDIKAVVTPLIPVIRQPKDGKDGEVTAKHLDEIVTKVLGQVSTTPDLTNAIVEVFKKEKVSAETLPGFTELRKRVEKLAENQKWMKQPMGGGYTDNDVKRVIDAYGGGGGAEELGDLTDVDVSDTTSNHVLTRKADGTFEMAAPPGASGGEANTASNLGTGEGVFGTKVGVDLRYKSLVGGSGVTLSSDTNEITIDRDAITKSDITDFDEADYATAAQGSLADSALQNITGENLTDLADVDTDKSKAPTNGDVLTFDGTDWNAETPSGGGASALDDLSDVSITSATEFDFLQYNGTNFVNELAPPYKEVFNSSGSTITEGTIVAITGSAGAVPLITVADKDTDDTAAGIVVADIVTGTSGIIELTGTIQESFINTSGMTAGNTLYLGDTGAYTDVRPTSGNIIRIGKVGVVAPSNGSLLLDMPANAFDISEDLTPTLAGDLDADGNDILDVNRMIVGASTGITTANNNDVQHLGTGNADSSITLGRFSNTGQSGHIDFVKSRNASIGGNTIVNDNDILGELRWYPADGADFATQAAIMHAEVDDASPAAGDIGTAFVWKNMPGGGGSLTERMRLAANGTLTLAGNVVYRAGGTDVPVTDGGTGASTAAGAFTNLKQAASTTATGVVEIATLAEVNTGTDTTRSLTPDTLSGSYAGTKSVTVQIQDGGTALAVGDGKAYFIVPAELNGMDLVGVRAGVVTAGTTGTTDFQIHNVTDAVDMLSTKLTIDSTETTSATAATAAVINAANDAVATDDVLRIDVDAVSTTAPEGGFLSLTFRLP